MTSLLAGAASIAVIVLSIIWLYRIAANHRALGRQLTWAPGWAIAGWILPPLLFIIPLLMLRESWKASPRTCRPDRRSGSRRATRRWSGCGSSSTASCRSCSRSCGAAQFWNVSRDTEDLAEYFDEQVPLIVAQGVVTVLAAIAWALVVRDITRRHTQLTGETTLR